MSAITLPTVIVTAASVAASGQKSARWAVAAPPTPASPASAGRIASASTRTSTTMPATLGSVESRAAFEGLVPS